MICLVPEVAELVIHGLAMNWVQDSADHDISDLAFCMDTDNVDSSLEWHGSSILGW